MKAKHLVRRLRSDISEDVLAQVLEHAFVTKCFSLEDQKRIVRAILKVSVDRQSVSAALAELSGNVTVEMMTMLLETVVDEMEQPIGDAKQSVIDRGVIYLTGLLDAHWVGMTLAKSPDTVQLIHTIKAVVDRALTGGRALRGLDGVMRQALLTEDGPGRSVYSVIEVDI